MQEVRLLLVLLGVAGLSLPAQGSFSSRGDVEGPEDEYFRRAWGMLHAAYPRVLEGLVTGFGMDRNQRQAFRERLETRVARTLRGDKASEACNECVDLVGLFQALLDLGFEFEDLREPAVDICYSVVEGEYNPDLLCPGIVNNFGVHLVNVLKASDKDAEEICLIVDDCTPDDITPLNEKHGGTDAVTGGRIFQAVPSSTADLDTAIKILYMTDIHVDPEYYEGGTTKCDMPNCCRQLYSNGTGSAGNWGDYGCNIPKRTAELFLERFAEEDPDMILYTGDTPPHYVWLETQEYQLSVSRYLAQQIETHYPGVPAFTSIGNHETFPTNMYYTGRPEIREFNEEFTQYWKPLSNFTVEEEETFRAGCYFTKVVQPGLRVISYNTNYGSSENWYTVLAIDEPEYKAMTDFLTASLNLARANNEKVIMLGHHMGGLSFYRRFMDPLIADNGDLIILHLFGHSHSDGIQVVSNGETGDIYNIKMSMGSMGTHTDINPSARIIYLDPQTFVPLDAETYHLDMQTIDEKETPEIKLTYKHSTEYGMGDLTPSSWTRFLDRMFDDAALFSKWRYNEATRTGKERDCDDNCRKDQLCRLRFSGNAQKSCQERYSV